MPNKEEIARRLLSYLEKNPHAGDHLEGIANWWLQQQRIEEAVEEVSEALAYLVETGALRAQKNQQGNTIYRVKNDHY